MGFWGDLFKGGAPNHEGVTPNVNGAGYVPGDPDGVGFDPGDSVEARALPFPMPSAWSGWPGQWSTPNFGSGVGFNKMIDTAWNCLDLNSSVLASMPVYRMSAGDVVAPFSWMVNPDPDIYTSWQEFAKQLFWDYQMGEAFVLPMAHAADGYPLRFRVVPPWLVNVELRDGRREYTLGSTPVTDEILHIRYQSTTTDAHGHGPLEVAGERIAAAGLLQRYANKIAETGGTPLYWLNVDRKLNAAEGADLLDRWVESRTRRAGEPALVTGGATLNQAQSMSAKDMTLLELEQFAESRIAVALGVPPFLAGLPSGGDAMTYSNVSQLFDFHDRASLRPKACAVMAALSGWALPRGQIVELNRDEYSRPSLKERAESYKILIEAGVMTTTEARTMERLNGPAPRMSGPDGPDPAALSLTGGLDA